MSADPHPSARAPESSADAFHAHLDKCAQCAGHPFGLCPIGECLLRDTAERLLREADARVSKFFEVQRGR